MESDKEHLINDEIRGYDEVRLVYDDGRTDGVVPFDEALDVAYDLKLDLVLIAPKAKPPVCKVLNYNQVRLQSHCFHCGCPGFCGCGCW